MIRIVAGEARRRHLAVPENKKIRPTADKVREAVFNSLYGLRSASGQPFPQNLRVLDLFAGSGALGLEALSRGAEFVTFVDMEKSAIKAIHENLSKLGYSERAELVRFDALEYIKNKNEGWDLVFLDPPYEFENWEGLLSLLTKSAVLVIESNREIETAPELWETVKKGTYSNSYIKVCINTQIKEK